MPGPLSGGTTTRLGLPYPGENDAADGPLAIQNLAEAIDTSLYSQGTLAARPVSTGGSPGIAGRVYEATDQTPRQIFLDHGTGWDWLNPVDQAANVPSLRTLGTGAGQAAPGNSATFTKVLRQTHSFTTDDQSSPDPAVGILGSFFITAAASEAVTLIEAVVHCTTVGGTPSVFKVRYDHAAHGTLADVPGLTALTPSTTQTAVTATGAPLALAAFDRIVVAVVTAGASKGCTIQIVTEHTV